MDQRACRTPAQPWDPVRYVGQLHRCGLAQLGKRALKIHGAFPAWKHFLLFHFQPALILRQRLPVIPDLWGDDVSGENWTSSPDGLLPGAPVSALLSL